MVITKINIAMYAPALPISGTLTVGTATADH